jgi:hypothetical protein
MLAASTFLQQGTVSGSQSRAFYTTTELSLSSTALFMCWVLTFSEQSEIELLIPMLVVVVPNPHVSRM